MEEFKLPTYWNIKVTPENANIINEWKQEFNPNSHNANECSYVNSYGSGHEAGGLEITFNQFKKYVLKQDDMEKEIIGYKVPFELFNGEVKLDFIYKPLASKNNRFYVPVNKEGKVGLPHLNLPKEIVEQWEPVYKAKYSLPKINGYEGEFIRDGMV